MIPPGHPPSSRSPARADGAAEGPPRGACPGARKPLTYGARKQPHVRFPLPGNVSEAQRGTIRKLAEALGVDPAELVEDPAELVEDVRSSLSAIIPSQHSVVNPGWSYPALRAGPVPARRSALPSCSSHLLSGRIIRAPGLVAGPRVVGSRVGPAAEADDGLPKSSRRASSPSSP